MSIRMMSRVWDSSPFDSYTLLLLLALADHADDEGWSFPKVPSLMKKCRQPERTVYQGLKNLIDAGWLIKHTRDNKTFYRITPDGTKPTAQGAEPPPSPGPYTAHVAVPTAHVAEPTARCAEPPHPHIGVTINEPSVTPQPPASPSGGSAPAKAPARKPGPMRVLPACVPTDAWRAYVEHRRGKKVPITDKALDLILGKLQRWHAAGMDVREVLEQSVINGWTGIFEVKNRGNHDARTNQATGNNRTARNAAALKAVHDRIDRVAAGETDEVDYVPNLGHG